jgi:hypothetical protein
MKTIKYVWFFMPTGHTISGVNGKKVKNYVDILQFSIHAAWLENHRQVTARQTSQTISYTPMVSRYVTHLLQKEQCLVRGVFKTCPSSATSAQNLAYQ